jgi:hypothetical protein
MISKPGPRELRMLLPAPRVLRMLFRDAELMRWDREGRLGLEWLSCGSLFVCCLGF